jgi:hypothetical protein
MRDAVESVETIEDGNFVVTEHLSEPAQGQPEEVFLTGNFQNNSWQGFTLRSLVNSRKLIKCGSCEEIVLEDFIELVNAVVDGNILGEYLPAARI